MKKRITKQTALTFVLLAVLSVGVVVVLQDRPRDLAQRTNPDGTSTVIVGKPRLGGLMGIEIVLEHRNQDGKKTYGSVQDLLGSWKEACVRYENPEGGGLLTPLDEQ